MKKMTAGQLMTHNVLTVRSDWTIDRLMEFFTDKSISGAPVVGDDDVPIGVVSHTDIARNGIVTERTRDDVLRSYQSLENVVAPEETRRFRIESPQATVRDIMTPMVFTVDDSATAQEVAEMMITGRIHRVFVKQRGKLTGVITSMDLLPLVRDM